MTCKLKDGVLRADDTRPADLEHVQLHSACAYHYATFAVQSLSLAVGGDSGGSAGSFTMAFATSSEFVEEEEERFAVSIALPAGASQPKSDAHSTAVSSYEYHLLADAAPARKQQHKLIHTALTQLSVPAALFFALLQRAAATLPAEARQRVERHLRLTAAMYSHLHEGGQRPDEEGEEEDGSEDEEEDDEDDGADLEGFVVADDVVVMDTDASDDDYEETPPKTQRGGQKQMEPAKPDRPQHAGQKQDRRASDDGVKETKAGPAGQTKTEANGVGESSKHAKPKGKQNGSTKPTQQSPRPKQTREEDKQQPQQPSKAEQLVHHTSGEAAEQHVTQPSPRKEKRKRDEQQQTGYGNRETTQPGSAQSLTADGKEDKRAKKAKKESSRATTQSATEPAASRSEEKSEAAPAELNKAGDRRGMKQKGKVRNPLGVNGQSDADTQHAGSDTQSGSTDKKQKQKVKQPEVAHTAHERASQPALQQLASGHRNGWGATRRAAK